jgi:hypothetical protein
MAEAEKSRTALVLELERVELEAQAEVLGSLGPASEGGSAVAKAALERQRAAAQALRRKLKMKDAQLAQYVDLAHSFVCLYNGPRLWLAVNSLRLNRFHRLPRANFIELTEPSQATQAAWCDLAVLKGQIVKGGRDSIASGAFHAIRCRSRTSFGASQHASGFFFLFLHLPHTRVLRFAFFSYALFFLSFLPRFAFS